LGIEEKQTVFCWRMEGERNYARIEWWEVSGGESLWEVMISEWWLVYALCKEERRRRSVSNFFVDIKQRIKYVLVLDDSSSWLQFKDVFKVNW
jgi:hypothetical protein